MKLSGRSPSLIVAAALGFGFAFLYLPIGSLILYSFNGSRLVTVWTGFSTRWYGELLANARLIDAARLSLGVAACAATLATVIGTFAGLAMARLGRFPGRLLFVALNADRGFWTVTVAHTTVTLSFVAVVVQSRLISFDRSLEEAAMDLGCPP